MKLNLSRHLFRIHTLSVSALHPQSILHAHTMIVMLITMTTLSHFFLLNGVAAFFGNRKRFQHFYLSYSLLLHTFCCCVSFELGGKMCVVYSKLTYVSPCVFNIFQIKLHSTAKEGGEKERIKQGDTESFFETKITYLCHIFILFLQQCLC